MKTIGLLGGMSWESSTTYYQLINREVQRRLGGVHSAKIVMHSFDFGEIAPLQSAGRWPEANARMAEAARSLVTAGAGVVVMCCNTMHCATPEIERAIAVPFLHIADPLGRAIRDAGLSRVALLGSRHTMAQDGIIRGRLRERYGISVIVPEGDDFDEIDRVIFEELVRGRFLDASRTAYRTIIAKLVAQGAEGVVLGCTELPLLVASSDATVPLFDTTALHALAAAELALA
jgi:aspartate racemase